MTPTTFAAARCSASRISTIVVRGTDRSKPPASPLVQMQYDTSMPASVQRATRTGVAEVDVVGMRGDDQDAFDTFVDWRRQTSLEASQLTAGPSPPAG